MIGTKPRYCFRLSPYTDFVKGLTRVNPNDFDIYDDSSSESGPTDIHILTSPHIDLLNDENEIYQKVKGFLMLINGALSISLGFERYKWLGPLKIDAAEGVNVSYIDAFESSDIDETSPFAIGIDMTLAKDSQEF
ncbi:hypothetical protein [Enterobacter mori]|uniref:hypothetical protein n=1 Tax=Enterobacter mori TaxID=539813 RepID=UPI0012F4EEDB|nr:hypothetical protein [Enterobacter mori]